MTRLPRLKGRELVRLLEKIGFEIVRTRGSHVFLNMQMEGLLRYPCMLEKLLGPVF